MSHYIRVCNDQDKTNHIVAWHHVEVRTVDHSCTLYKWYPKSRNLTFECISEGEWEGWPREVTVTADPSDLVKLGDVVYHPPDIKLHTFDFTVPVNTTHAQWLVGHQLPAMVKLLVEDVGAQKLASITYLGFYSKWTVESWRSYSSGEYRVWRWELNYYDRVLKVLSESTEIAVSPDLDSQGWMVGCPAPPLEGWGIPGLMSPVY